MSSRSSSRTETLSARLCESFRNNATRVAVQAGGESVTYAELAARSQAVAAGLAAHGIGRQHRVGLWMDKSIDGLAALLGTLLAGAAYVPLDVKAPVKRSLQCAADAEISALVVDELRRSLLPEVEETLPSLRLVLEAETGGPVAPASSLPTASIAALAGTVVDRQHQPPDPEEPAYILFTSGSTGTPKGVVISHRAALGFVDWCQQVLQPQPEDRMVSHAPWHFDLSTFDLLVTLLSGASVRLLNATEAMLAPWIARNLREWGITVWYSVPSVLIAMLEQQQLDGKSWPQARLVLFAGEPFPTPKLYKLRQALPGARLFNLFGPTETNVCTYHEVKELAADETRPIPIGRVCEQLEGLILDEELSEVPAGSEGDLWIAGPNLLSSYWGDPELSRRRLRPHPRPGREGLCYNTGDRVRLGSDGNLIFLGRRDHMVKVRGFRVELGEVESALHSSPLVGEAAVVPVAEGSSHRLVGFVSWKDSRPDQEGLLQHLRERVPLYMIPEHWHQVERLPRTSNGKIDRVALVADAARLQGETTSR